MIEPNPNVNRGQCGEVVGTVITSVTPASVIFVGRETMREVRHSPPSELARLVDSALAQCSLDQFDRFVRLVVVVARKDDGRNARPRCGGAQIQPCDAVSVKATKDRPLSAALGLELLAVQLIDEMAKLALMAEWRRNHYAANHPVGVLVSDGRERNIGELFVVACAL
jgi:hypothetical protein